MLRTLFVLSLTLVGLRYSLNGPFFVLLLYIWIGYFRPEEWVWGDFIKSLNLSLLSGLGLVGSFALSKETLRFDLRAGVLALFLAHTALSMLWAENPEFSGGFWIDFVKSSIVTYLIALLAAERGRFRIVVMVMALSLGFEAAKQGWIQLLTNPGEQNHNEIAFLGDNNAAAVGILMLFAMFLSLARTATGPWERRLHYFMAFGVFYRAVITYSRGGFLAAGALLLWQVLRAPQRMRAVATLAVATMLVLPALPTEFWDRMSTIGTADEDKMDTSARGRLHFWDVALVMANEKPITGVGYMGFIPAYDQYDFSYGTFGSSRAVHSSWLAVLAELGYPGLLLYALNLLLAWTACRRAVRLAREHPEYADLRHWAVAIETCLVVFVVAGTFVTVQYTEMIWHVMGLSAALNAMVVKARAAIPVEVPGAIRRPQPAAVTTAGIAVAGR
jgi:putative inorganic carbon (hco3(-)) transporter